MLLLLLLVLFIIINSYQFLLLLLGHCIVLDCIRLIIIVLDFSCISFLSCIVLILITEFIDMMKILKFDKRTTNYTIT